MQRLDLPRPPTRPRSEDVDETSDDRPAAGELPNKPLEQLRQDVEELRADLDWLTQQVKKLRGHITGGSRRTKEEPTNGTAEKMSLEELNAAIRAGRVGPRR